MDTLVAGPTTGLARFSTQGFEPQVLHSSDRQKVILAALEEGQHIPPHAPDVDLTVVVTSGVGDVATQTGTRAVRAGDVLVIPAGATRGLRARGGRLIAVLIVSPPPTTADHEKHASAGPWPAPSSPERHAATVIRDEHRHLHPRLEGLVSVADKIHDLTDGELRGRLATILTFLDRDLLAHAEVEEAVLYPRIDQLLNAVGGATATMSMDHDAIKRRISELSAAGDRLGSTGRQDIRRLLHELYGLLEVHFAKEEDVYLPLLDRLTPSEHAELLADLKRGHFDVVGDTPPR